MDWRSVTFDWNQVRAFLVAAEEGAFSAASRALGLTQPTIGRQVAALEERLGLILFERTGRSLLLTQAGLELLEHVRAMGEAARNISLSATGHSQSVEGEVCITATDVFALYLLPDVLKRLREIAPGISVEVIASNDVRDLRYREADIAIRHGRPDQPELIAKRLRDHQARLYAAPGYLDHRGRPEGVEDLRDADFIGFGRSDQLLNALNEAGIPVERRNFRCSSENGVVAWEMVKQGLGVGIMSEKIAALTPEVEAVLPGHEPLTFQAWLVTHRELHASRRIRIVFDLLAEAFS